MQATESRRVLREASAFDAPSQICAVKAAERSSGVRRVSSVRRGSCTACTGQVHNLGMIVFV